MHDKQHPQHQYLRKKLLRDKNNFLQIKKRNLGLKRIDALVKIEVKSFFICMVGMLIKLGLNLQQK